jgi:hypothetical protein
MPEKPKRRTSNPLYTSAIFEKFDCKELTYTLDVPRDEFALKQFYKKTGIPANQPRWSSVLRAKEPSTGYHIHFDGTVEAKSLRLVLRYYNKSRKPLQDEVEPFAETLMPWLGQFFKDRTWRAMVSVRFEKSTNRWRGKFNLPFKVTMNDAEVIIDGVSLVLPKNPFGAIGGWLARSGNTLMTSALLSRNIEFEKFNLGDELGEFNDATGIYTEEIKS